MHSKHNLLYLIAFITLLYGCGSDMNTVSNDTGALSFALKWETPSNIPLTKTSDISSPLAGEGKGEGGFNTQNSELSYAPIDCTAIGVSTVSANVYDSGGTYITSGGPWNCSAHSGTITGISAGINRMIAVSGKDSSNKIIYSGQITGVTINKDQTTDAGQITMTYVANDTTAPTDGTLSASAGNQQVSLSWSGFSDSGSGLGSYKLVYSTTSTPSSCSSGTQIWTGTGTSYTHTGLTNNTTYYYRVCAIDNAGNTSSGATASGIPTASGTTTGGTTTTGTTTTGTTTTVQGGIDSYNKLMLHADGSDQGTSFTDSETTPKTVINTETYDSYTKLMLHTEGSGNNFVDSAASKAVTANGDVTQTTAQYKLGSKSAAFNGTTDYLTLADSADWNFGTGDWTVDFWYKTPASWGSSAWLINQYETGGGVNYQFLVFGADASGFYIIAQTNNVQIAKYSTGVASITTDTWYHVAYVRNGANFYIFVNGVSSITIPYTPINANTVFPDVSTVLQIGKSIPNPNYNGGYLDELRISKGIARWTSNFTPPSSPYGKVYTVTGTKKFGTASGEFKGSGEYLSLADSDDWNFGTGDFTIDFWVRASDITTEAGLYAQGDVGSSIRFYVKLQSGEIKVDIDNTDSIVSYWTASSGIAINTWHHVAIVRNGNNFNTYVDGVSRGSASSSGSSPDASNYFMMGAAYSSGAGGYGKYLNGWLDELRISKGIARWTSNFTPPSAPYYE